MNWFRFVPGYEPAIHDPGREPLFLLLLAFLITFVLTRLYTRLARERGWGSGSVGGVHVHHMVPGIFLMLSAGLFNFAFDPYGWWYNLLAVLFGVGAALTLDEFALWFHLDDVYWSREGRSSIDAVVATLLFGGLCLVASAPFGAEKQDLDQIGRRMFFAVIAFHVLTSVIAILKGKLILGVLSVAVPVVGLVAALRLAKPDSPWARWFYREDGGRMARSNATRCRERYESRWRRWKARHDQLDDLIGGAPSVADRPERPIA